MKKNPQLKEVAVFVFWMCRALLNDLQWIFLGACVSVDFSRGLCVCHNNLLLLLSIFNA